MCLKNVAKSGLKKGKKLWWNMRMRLSYCIFNETKFPSGKFSFMFPSGAQYGLILALSRCDQQRGGEQMKIGRWKRKKRGNNITNDLVNLEYCPMKKHMTSMFLLGIFYIFFIVFQASVMEKLLALIQYWLTFWGTTFCSLLIVVTQTVQTIK